MKNLHLFFLSLILFSCSIQEKPKNTNKFIKVQNIANTQISILNQYKEINTIERNKILLDSIYNPYINLWNNYLGDEKDFLKWANNNFHLLDGWNTKSKNLNSNYLTDKLKQTAIETYRFTGFLPKGEWYILYGPSWTNLGGFGNGTMLIDLAHFQNINNEKIIQVFPHELNHQIYSHTLKNTEDKVLNRILNEGFAVYVSYIFHKKKHSIAEELGYSESEYQFCKENERELLKLLKEHYNKTDNSISRNFANRMFKFNKNYPGAIGYYLGFRIVEEFVKHNGKNSWKKIYTTDPEKVLLQSKILNGI